MSAQQSDEGGRRPNVLFILCDDLNDSLEGFGGHPQAKTPHLQRLMRRGVSFGNAHCNAPICAPSRASLWSGLLPHTSGSYTFTDWRENAVLKETVMLQRHLRNHGYAVWGTGKLFHNGQEEYSLYDDFGHEANFGPFPYDGKHKVWGQVHPQMSALFDSDPDMPIPWEQTFGPLSRIPHWDDVDGEAPGPDAGWQLYNKPYRYVNDDDRDPMPDELSAQWACERLRQPSRQPFFLGVGFNRPHTPLYVPQTYFDLFPVESLDLPPHRDGGGDAPPAITRHLYTYGLRRFAFLQKNGGEALWKQWIQAYLACVRFVDDQVGKLLDALEASPAADNTVVVFTSDNGYHMGEKEVLFKNTLWEESTRVPLIVRAPGVAREGDACAHPVSLVDLYPTLCDLCGLGAAPNAAGNGKELDGRSLAPLLREPQSDAWPGDTGCVTAMATTAEARDAYGDTIGPAQFTLRDQRWRYTRFGNGEEELYDHDTDPQEGENRAADNKAAETKAELKARLNALAPPSGADGPAAK